MSEKYTSQIKFIGNGAATALYNEIVKRFQDDRMQGNPELTAIKRILFGLDGDAEFNSFENTGANWAYPLDRKNGLEFFSPNVPVHKLQDYITKYATKVDPDLIVEMNYIGSTPELVGSRFTRIDEDGDFFEEEEKYNLTGCYFCAEDDVESTIRDLKYRNVKYNDVISFEELDQIIKDVREQAFNRI